MKPCDRPRVEALRILHAEDASIVNLQKAGGIAALVEAFAYVVGFVVMATLLNPGSTEGWSSAQKLSFVLDRKALFQSWSLLIYVIAGAVLVVLSVAIHERLRDRSPAIMQIATAFGLIWAGLVMASGMVEIVGLESMARIHARSPTQAVSSWSAIAAVQEGLGGGIELVGGLWVALISVAALPSTALPKTLSYLGLLIGIAGILTAIPYFAELVAVFGLGQILWFVWIGLLMLRDSGATRSLAVAVEIAEEREGVRPTSRPHSWRES